MKTGKKRHLKFYNLFHMRNYCILFGQYTIFILLIALLLPAGLLAQETPADRFNSSPIFGEFTYAFESAAMGNLRFVNRDHNRELLYQPGVLNDRRGPELLTGTRTIQQRRVTRSENELNENINGNETVNRNREWFTPFGFVIQNEDAHFVVLSGYASNRYRVSSRGLGENQFSSENRVERSGMPLQSNFSFALSNRFSAGVSFSGSFVRRDVDINFSHGNIGFQDFSSETIRENNTEFSGGLHYDDGTHRLYAKSTFYNFRFRSEFNQPQQPDTERRFYRGLSSELQWHFQASSGTILSVRTGYLFGTLQNSSLGRTLRDTGEEEEFSGWLAGLGISHRFSESAHLYAEAEFYPATIREGEDRTALRPDRFDDTYRQWAVRIGNRYGITDRITIYNGFSTSGYRTRFEREIDQNQGTRFEFERNNELDVQMLVTGGLSFDHQRVRINGFVNYEFIFGSPVQTPVLQFNLPSLSAGASVAIKI